jgi:hypothetical protein
MRRFVIIEKHQPWIWDDDVITYHDKDFIIIRAQRLRLSVDVEDEELATNNTFYRGFILFDKNVFGNFSEFDIKIMSAANKMDYYHDGLPVCKNKRIFAPVLRAYTDIDINTESIMLILHRKRDEVMRTLMAFKKI